MNAGNAEHTEFKASTDRRKNGRLVEVMTRLSRVSLLGTLALASGCSSESDERQVGPLAGDYGTELSIESDYPGVKIRLDTNGTPMEFPLARVNPATATFRFPFPAIGTMQLVEGDDVIRLPSFRPSTPLGTPAIGAFDDRKLLDVMLGTGGKTFLTFAGSIVAASPDGAVKSFAFDVGARTPAACPLYPMGDSVGAVFVQDRKLVRVELDGERAVTVPTSVETDVDQPLLAAASDERGAYVWLQTTSSTISRFRAADWTPEGAPIPLPGDAVKEIGEKARASLSVAPDGTVWVAWAQRSDALFDVADTIGASRLAPAMTSFGEAESFEYVDDTIEHLRIRATDDGIDFFVCGYDSPNMVDRTDHRYCYPGHHGAGNIPTSQGSAPSPTAQQPIAALTDDASLTAVCSKGSSLLEELQVLRGGERILSLHPCSSISMLSIAKHPAGGATVVVMANGGIYSLPAGR